MAIKLEYIRNYLRIAPFKSFDIRMSDGRAYTIDHPEFLMLSHDQSVVYHETEDGQLITLAVSQIASLEVANTHAA